MEKVSNLEVPADAFTDIIKELVRQPLQINKYRDKAGSGRSQAFGIVGRRCLPPDYSRLCWMRPYLYKLLLDYGKTYVDISWNSVTVNTNYQASPHRDKNNVGDSYLVAFGDFTGGELKIDEGELQGLHTIRHKPITTDFSKVYHSVLAFEGNRYSLVYYQFQNSRSVPLPPPTVKEEKGKYYFYRGDDKITRKTPLPHPLHGRRREPFTFKKIEQTITMTFD